MRTIMGDSADVPPGEFQFSDIFTEYWRYIVFGAGLLLSSVAFWICVVNRGARVARKARMQAHGAPTFHLCHSAEDFGLRRNRCCISFLC